MQAATYEASHGDVMLQHREVVSDTVVSLYADIHSGDGFEIYKNIKTLCCIPQSDIIFKSVTLKF